MPINRRMQYRLELRLFLAISLLASLLPRKVMVKTGRFLGGVGYSLWKNRRKIALENIEWAFRGAKTSKEKVWVAREAFKNIGATVLELGWGFRRMNRAVFQRAVVVEGLKTVASALAKKKGLIILPAHYGNWEIMANAIGYLNIHAHFVAKRLKNPSSGYGGIRDGN